MTHIDPKPSGPAELRSLAGGLPVSDILPHSAIEGSAGRYVLSGIEKGSTDANVAIRADLTCFPNES
jgi:hypothetical protein